ncbi:MAG: hypothetical protein Q7U73_15415 [Rubrivivax sp.]|nr:hypothetical protein [Rubrivivax sp.]
MAIHQIQVRYEATADRLLLQLRTTQAEVYAVWLTRRMLQRLYPPFRQAVAQASVASATPQALPVPEARQMLEHAALQQTLRGADFAQPFAIADATHPLGLDPLLPDAADLRPGAAGQLTLAVREPRGRRIEIALNAELAGALLRLLDSALVVAEWGLPALVPDGGASAAEPAGAEPGRLLS